MTIKVEEYIQDPDNMLWKCENCTYQITLPEVHQELVADGKMEEGNSVPNGFLKSKEFPIEIQQYISNLFRDHTCLENRYQEYQ